MANITDVEFTTSGYIEVFAPDGSYVSRHRLLDEARESALNHAIQHLSKDPEGIDEPYTESFEYTFVSPGTRMSISILQGIGGRTSAGDVDPPLAPVGVFLSNQTDNTVQINWTTNAEPDIRDYRVYKSTTSATLGFEALQIVLTPGNSYVDTTFLSTEDTWYKVTARDNALNESEFSATVSYSTPTATGDNATRISTALNGETPHFSYNTPVDPVTTSTFNVPADGSFATAVSVSGRLVLVADGYSGSGTSNWGDDVDVVMSNTATITSNCDFGSSQRIRWTGGNVVGDLRADGFTDILIDNVNVSGAGTSATNWAVNARPFQRLAILNSTLVGVGTSGSGWGHYVRPTSAGPSPGTNHQDMIIVNTLAGTNNYQGARIMAVDNLVIVNSVAFGSPSNTGQAGWRFHYNCNDIYIKNVVGRGTNLWAPQPPDTELAGTNMIVDNMHTYNGSGTSRLWAVEGASGVQGTIQNSTLHWISGSGTILLGNLTDGGNNTLVPWDGSTYDYTIIPGVTSLSDVGADH